jgi:hypothetical protein
MPTGYTAFLQEKPDMSFRDFALLCARAFGACIMQRDDELSTELVFDKPSDYHSNALKEAKKTLKETQNWSVKQSKEDLNADIYSANCRMREELKEQSQWKETYETMLDLVNKWKPPTEGHAQFKEFMIEQLTQSIEWDCNSHYYTQEVDRLNAFTPEEWKEEKIKNAIHDIEYHTKNHAEEVERIKQRNEWKYQLIQSLD